MSEQVPTGYTTIQDVARDPAFEREFQRRMCGEPPGYDRDDDWNGERGRAFANWLIVTRRRIPRTFARQIQLLARAFSDEAVL